MSRIEVIGIGASLGGLAALERLLGALPAGFPASIVIVQHRRADAGNRLVELLQKHSPLPLTEPDDKEPIERSHVYVAPADYHLIVERGFFALSVDPPVFFSRPSIDVMFESIADSYGAAAVAVMLTCANEDGAAGARAVKNAGGRVLVQDPSTAESAVAPRAVLASVTVDGVHDIEGLAARLVELAG